MRFTRPGCSAVVTVGVHQSPDDPDPVASVRRPDVSSTHHERPAGVARRFQITEDDICAATAQSRHVLDEHPAWLEFADEAGELAPEAAALAGDAFAFPRARDVLTGEAAGDAVDGLEGGGVAEADVAASVDMGPVPFEDVATVGVDFDLPAHSEAGALQAQIDATD